MFTVAINAATLEWLTKTLFTKELIEKGFGCWITVQPHLSIILEYNRDKIWYIVQEGYDIHHGVIIFSKLKIFI
ncbi:hypothetical protein [Coxiella-like endosymbiont of Amblyomma americanum]|uniref:hypothetical protein n=1 Tax=Coxiella-like endosymbiont of Amblyomma americanum TaxID=1987500 RepID=UPI000F89E313|nr:hypothetical protein [Coxiella-like endosymbiont of Amblyomma americanum]AUJ58739.1 hypothetical protein B1F76_01415 [Coxiella-like endosymbiont of Amblyomma americanum]